MRRATMGKRTLALQQYVERFGPVTLRNSGSNHLVKMCRAAQQAKMALQYKMLDDDRRMGVVLLWVKGQEKQAEQLAVKYGRHLPHLPFKRFRMEPDVEP